MIPITQSTTITDVIGRSKCFDLTEKYFYSLDLFPYISLEIDIVSKCLLLSYNESEVDQFYMAGKWL